VRFMLLAKLNEAATIINQELFQAIDKLTADMQKAGILVDTGGLLPTAQGGTLIRLSGGKLSVTDGPFTEAKEVIGGYAIVDVKSKEEAIELSKKFLQVHADILGPSFEMTSEIRQMFEEPTFTDIKDAQTRAQGSGAR
jgi:hypothetical protein